MSFARVSPEEIAEAAAAAGRKTSAPDLDTGAPRMIDDLLSSLILPPEEEDRRKGVHHLSGQIARVRLPMLCSLFEVERLSGVLVLRRDIEEVRIYLDSGQIVDLEPLTEAEDGRARLKSLLSWEDGTFEFDIRPVSRPNRIEMSMTALFIDLAREKDEAAKGSTPSG